MGFILRLTESNGYDTPAWILELSRLNHLRFGYSCPFVFRGTASLKGLSEVTGVELPELIKLTYPPAVAGDKYQEDQLFFGSPVPKHFIRVVRTKICPGCLRESNYCRRIWDLCAVTVCPEHETMLLDECPNCRRRVLWSRSKVSVCACGFDWREADMPRVLEPESRLTRHIYRLCGYEISGGHIGGNENNPLLGRDLKGVLTNLLFIAWQQQESSPAEVVGAGVKNIEIHSHLTKAFAVFDDWPRAFHKFLEGQRKNSHGTRGPLRRRPDLYKDFGNLYVGLYRKSGADGFELLRNAFTDYVEQRGGGGHLGRTGWRYVVTAANGRQYVSKYEARRRLKIDGLRLARYVEAGELETIVPEGASAEEYLLEVSGLEKLRHELSPALDTAEALDRLGVGKNMLKCLIEAGLMERPAAGPAGRWEYSRGSIDDLLGAIEGAVTLSASVPVRGEVGFHKVVRMLCPLGLKMPDFIKAILGGEIAPYRITSAAGVSRFMFEEEAVTRFAQRVRSGVRLRLHDPTKDLAA